VTFASSCSLTVTNQVLKKVYDNLDWFRSRIVLRPQEISNSPEIIRRLGIISVNTAIEVDIFGNVNSTHVMGRKLMNGIGGSGDFTRNAYISIFSCPSTQKSGKISTIVPMVSHTDHSEHSVQVVATENGVADLRGKDPGERAAAIIDHCAHPDYRDQLRAYLKIRKEGHALISLNNALAMHQRFVDSADMRGVEWNQFEETK
jgi:acyl-CoA hydrolase